MVLKTFSTILQIRTLVRGSNGDLWTKFWGMISCTTWHFDLCGWLDNSICPAVFGLGSMLSLNPDFIIIVWAFSIKLNRIVGYHFVT